MAKVISADEIPNLLKPGMTVYVGGATGESSVIREALRQRPDCAPGVHFIGAHLPDINSFDYSSLEPTARSTGIFVTAAQRDSFVQGRHRILRMGYFEFAQYLRRTEIDMALLLLSEPDDEGRFGSGLNADFCCIAADRAKIVIAEINSALPKRSSSSRICPDQVTYCIPSDAEISSLGQPSVDPTSHRIASNVAELIENGAILQIGIGKLPSAVLSCLEAHQRLGLHSGVVSDACLRLIAKGVMTGETNPLSRGVAVAAGALGSSKLYQSLDTAAIDLREASYTHSSEVLRMLPSFASINSAIEVDLFGQINAETVGGRMVSGVGGFNDFARAARSNESGRSIVALPSRSRDLSRIVPTLRPGAPITANSGDVDYIVTEHGTASLAGRTLEQRASALISIAHEDDREHLERSWHDLKARL